MAESLFKPAFQRLLDEPDDALRPDAPRGPFFPHPNATRPDAQPAGRRSLNFLRAGRQSDS